MIKRYLMIISDFLLKEIRYGLDRHMLLLSAWPELNFHLQRQSLTDMLFTIQVWLFPICCCRVLALDVYVHQMGGYSVEKVKEYFNLGEDIQPVAMMAVGYLGDGVLTSS